MMEYLLLAISAFGLGALHALEPGHGKTVVGAYLIGSKGTTWDAVLLGIVVTITHTGMVIILGILATVAAAYFVPETVEEVLELVAGLLIVGLGGWMIWFRIRKARHHHHHEGHSHDHDHGHHHGEDHSHDHEESHGHSHAPILKNGERPALWQLVTLGISGGIVPCPAALAVLLAATSFGSFLRGVSLVVIFSFGMAMALVAIGITMVHAVNFAGKFKVSSRWTTILPIVSAVLVTLIGIGLTVKALIDVLG